MTIEDFFGKLDALLGEDPDILKIEYDAELGYPTSVRVDYEKDAIDDELAYEVMSFDVGTSRI